MPALGLGIYQSPPEQTTGAVETAIANGYRLIDTAAAYFNEREVGEGIRPLSPAAGKDLNRASFLLCAVAAPGCLFMAEFATIVYPSFRSTPASHSFASATSS